MTRWLPLAPAASLAGVPAFAQNGASLVAVEGYGNLETAGAIATITGDVDRNAAPMPARSNSTRIGYADGFAWIVGAPSLP